MDRTPPFSVCSHVDPLETVKSGDPCFVRWVENEQASWYFSVIQSINPLGCVVLCNGATYDISWKHDEFVAAPSPKVVQYIGRFPSSAVVQVASIKYLVPAATCNIKTVVDALNVLRASHRLPQIEVEKRWHSFTVEGVAKATKFNRVLFAEA